MNISDGRVDARDLNWMHFSASDFERHRLAPGDVIITEGDLASAMNVGRSAVFRGEVPECCIQNSLLRFRLNGAGEPSFFHFAFEHLRKHGHFAHATMSTTVFHLSAGRLATISIAVPDEPEQRQIAAILDTIDDAIRKTEQIIAKLKQVKQGLLHDLLTRGIDDNGELRDPERHPEQFKDSPLGRIPRGWAIRRLDGAADVIDPNPSHRNPVYVKRGLPFISTVEFLEPDGVETNTPRRVAVVTVEEQERRCSFRPGSIAFSRKGTIGATRFLPTTTRFALLDSLCVVNAREGVPPRFLIEVLRSRALRRQLTNVTMGVALPQVSIGRVRSLLVPVPPRDEQDALSDSLEAAAARFQDEWEAGTKLRSVKAGLMEDLLTGRVRVTKLLESAAP